jgi:hypothetical protein
MTYNQKYGKPQGNELVYGQDIIRRIDIFEFRLIDSFKSSRSAHIAYNNWMKENDWNIYTEDGSQNLTKYVNDIMSFSKENLKDCFNFIRDKKPKEGWSHTRPIIGQDENGQPIIYDSWRNK